MQRRYLRSRGHELLAPNADRDAQLCVATQNEPPPSAFWDDMICVATHSRAAASALGAWVYTKDIPFPLRFTKDIPFYEMVHP